MEILLFWFVGLFLIILITFILSRFQQIVLVHKFTKITYLWLLLLLYCINVGMLCADINISDVIYVHNLQTS